MYELLRAMGAPDCHLPESAFARSAGGSRGPLKKGLKAEQLWLAWVSFSSVSDFPECLSCHHQSIMSNRTNPFPATPPRAEAVSGKRSRSGSHAPHTSAATRWEVRKRVSRGVDEFSELGWRAIESGGALESREFEHVRGHARTGLPMWKGFLHCVLGFVSPHQLTHVSLGMLLPGLTKHDLMLDVHDDDDGAVANTDKCSVDTMRQYVNAVQEEGVLAQISSMVHGELSEQVYGGRLTLSHVRDGSYDPQLKSYVRDKLKLD